MNEVSRRLCYNSIFLYEHFSGVLSGDEPKALPNGYIAILCFRADPLLSSRVRARVFVLFSISAVENAVCVRVLFNITAAETR